MSTERRLNDDGREEGRSYSRRFTRSAALSNVNPTWSGRNFALSFQEVDVSIPSLS
jgi:hypothetical protein